MRQWIHSALSNITVSLADIPMVSLNTVNSIKEDFAA